MKKMVLHISFISLLTAVSLPVQAAVKPASLFQDHAVLQRDIPLPVWGTAAPGSRIRVAFRDQVKEATTDVDGKWRVVLDPLQLGPAAEMKISGDGEMLIRDLLVGEVWFAAGQSNMVMFVSKALHPEKEIAAADYPGIRFYRLKTTAETYAEPLEEPIGRWKIISPESVGKYSAVGYFFARELHEKLGVPVGIVQAAKGSSPIAAWMSREALQAPEFSEVRHHYEKLLAQAPHLVEEYQRKLTNWSEQKEAAERSAKPFRRRKPSAPITPSHPLWISGLFNTLVNPLIPFSIRGVIWYQGEADTTFHQHYTGRFSTMIADWRSRWGQGDFPFLFVQLPNGTEGAEPGENWAYLREAQAVVAKKVPHAYMAVTLDTGDPGDVHPPDKQSVANRLALLALDEVYHVQTSPKSPSVADWKIEGSRIVVRFDSAEKLSWREGSGRGFVLAGPDGEFHPATVQLQGNTAILSSEEVSEPTAFRYAWGGPVDPASILFNEAGLPAAPFRSDYKERPN